MDDFSLSIVQSMSTKVNPLHTIYTICRGMGLRVSRSKHKEYVRVYRRVKRLVKDGLIYEIQGTRDPSVFLLKELLKERN